VYGARELAKLDHDVGKDAVARYMPAGPRRPGRPVLPPQLVRDFSSCLMDDNYFCRNS